MIRLPLEVRKRLRKILPRILAYVPAIERERFKHAILSAVRTYFDIRRPKGINLELKRLFRSVRNPKCDPVKVWGSISRHAQQIVRQYDVIIGDLPDPNHVPADEFRHALSERVDGGGRLVKKKTQNRWKPQIAGIRGRGAPQKHDIDALVALLAAAYTRATGVPPTKSWSFQNRPTDFEIILRLVFRAIGLDRRSLRFSSIKGTLDRHQKAVRSLKLTNYEQTVK
jgi:hypothetical protein